MDWNAQFFTYLLKWNNKLQDDNSFVDYQDTFNKKTLDVLKSISEKY